jgi:uncharacterized protein YndB with AHSA1/START domain
MRSAGRLVTSRDPTQQKWVEKKYELAHAVLSRSRTVTELRWEIDVHASADRVFSLLAGLRDYDKWLPPSSSFRGTVKISEGPIAVGTTYVEPSPLGTRYGRVTVYEPPQRLDFEQPMTLRPRLLGVLGIRVSHTLTPDGESVHLVRVLKVAPNGPVRFFMAPVIRAFTAENIRLMNAIKTVAERDAVPGDAGNTPR